jgi:hypothetical protein
LLTRYAIRVPDSSFILAARRSNGAESTNRLSRDCSKTEQALSKVNRFILPFQRDEPENPVAMAGTRK